MITKFKLIFITIILAFNVSNVGASTQVEASVALIDNLIAETKEIASIDISSQVRKKRVNEIIENYFDYDLIARFTAGQAWRTASPEERKAYKTVFRQSLLSAVEMQFSYLANIDYKTLNTEVKGDKLIIVNGIISTQGSQTDNIGIAWRIRTKSNTPPRIIDIEVENISMLLVQQQENNAILRRNKGNFQELINAIESQNHQ